MNHQNSVDGNTPMDRILLNETFTLGLSDSWQQHVVGNGLLTVTDDRLCLANGPIADGGYTNAQIDDYQHRARRQFRWRPPLTLTVRARFSHPAASASHFEGARHLTGTAGFGFWNDPFMMTGVRTPTLPRAIWFFYSAPPSNMALARNIPGYGWKAATIDAWRWPFLLLAPTAPVAVPLMHLQPCYRLLWPIAQRALGVSEAIVDAAMTEWHIYTIEWGRKRARFMVDDTEILTCATPPRGPLGLVIWLDNQYMVVTPQGRLRHGVIQKETHQWLALAHVSILSSTT